MDHFDVCIVGAGVVGLAIAKELSCRRPAASVLLLEQHGDVGQETSSRNSEVIHAGIYYPPGTLKARLCIEGRERLYAYCKEHDVPYRQTGKFIVANTTELPRLEALERNAVQNGVTSLRHCSRAELRRSEPLVEAEQALFSPDSGIVDSHALMQSYLGQALSAGVCFAPYTRVERVQPSGEGFIINALCGPSGSEAYQFATAGLINCAGLHAPDLAARIAGLSAAHIPVQYLCKGSYFSLSGRSPFRHLIYPLPDPRQHGLGVHATLDMSGQVRFGPDVEYTDALDYRVDLDRHAAFCEAIRQYFPALDSTRLQPAYAGIRPKLQAPDAPFQDFIIQDGREHGMAGLVQLFGIESPGLTASLAIAREVVDRLDI